MRRKRKKKIERLRKKETKKKRKKEKKERKRKIDGQIYQRRKAVKQTNQKKTMKSMSPDRPWIVFVAMPKLPSRNER